MHSFTRGIRFQLTRSHCRQSADFIFEPMNFVHRFKLYSPVGGPSLA
jgi:hypothetical protein